MNQENKKTKMAIVLVGNPIQISIALGYLKEAKISSDELYVMAPVVSADELRLRVKEGGFASTEIRDILANSLVQTSEDNLAELQQIMLSQKSMTLNFEIPRIDCSDYTFIVKPPKPEVYVPRKMGIVNTKAKGKFRQKPLGITRPYMY